MDAIRVLSKHLGPTHIIVLTLRRVAIIVAAVSDDLAQAPSWLSSRGGTTMVRRGFACMTAALVLLLSAGSSAQTVAIAQISGVVADESGGALPGAEVTATHVTTGAVRFVVTGARGEYVLPNLPVGAYTLDVKLQGFTTYEQKGITLSVGASPAVNITLQIGALAETLTVTANTTMVDVRSTGVGT